MKCRHCGYEIPDGELYCRHCGKEVRIVPDYNPLDDVLAAQIKGGIDGGEQPLDDYDYVKSYTSDLQRGEGQKRRRKDMTGTVRQTAGNTESLRRRTGRVSGKTDTGREREKRRRAAEKRKQKKKKLRRRIIGVFILMLVVLAAAVFLIYQNSYAGRVSKGNKALAEKNYEEAEDLFKSAVKKSPKRAEAYTGLSQVYLAQDQDGKAETVLLDAVESYPDEVPIYKACIQFYQKEKELQKISSVLEDAPDGVREELSKYVSEGPEFSLDDSEVFDDVQQLSLKSDGEAIYYTTDGSDPDTSSQKYSKPIQIEEGTTKISAISVNKAGIPSLPVVKEYTVELPIEDAPAVTPSTGQYDTPTQIVIQVPDGYTAYYTMDKSDPTEKSTKYTGPIDMPEGNTIFKAVLVNGKGRLTGITTRNYELTVN